MMKWSTAEVTQATKILARSSSVAEAINTMQAKFKERITYDSLRNAFVRAGLDTPQSFLGQPEPRPEKEPKPEKGNITIETIVRLTRKSPLSFSDLCDRLDISPKRLRGLLDQAKAEGVKLRVENSHVGLDTTTADPSSVQLIDTIAPVVGERQMIGVISDTHLGSKYCLRAQLQDFVQYAYDQGVRDIVHPGDVLDGMYKHGMWEVSHSGLEAQAEDLFETLPQLPGLRYHCITGNHDFTFTEASGVNVGNFIEFFFAQRGRSDVKFYGDRGAFLKLRGAVIHLWHPRSGVSYARSYALQKNIEKYGSIKPQIMLAGHWHVFCHVFERNVHGIACPTFQGGQSAFSKSLGGAPAIGGLILSWTVTEHGTIRDFSPSTRFYYEKEQPVLIYNNMDAIPVPVERR